MATPDYEQANAYARQRLATELARDLYYHSLAHIEDEVVPAVERLAAREGVSATDLQLLRTAAWYHDLGFVAGPRDHEHTGARLAAAVLPRFGLAPDAVRLIAGLILATRADVMPQTHLDQILVDADLDVLGQPTFLARNRDLRAERAAYGSVVPDRVWYRDQLRFLEAHRYWTAAARALRGAGKRANIAALEDALSQAEGGGAGGTADHWAGSPPDPAPGPS